MACSVNFAELHCLSNFSFQRGASSPEELVDQAVMLGYQALAITDECSLAGVVRAHRQAKLHGLPLIIGSEFRLTESLHFLLLATNRDGYGALSRLITQGRRQASKGDYCLSMADCAAATLDDCLAIWLPNNEPDMAHGQWLKQQFPYRCWLGLGLFLSGQDQVKLQQYRQLAAELDLPLVACNDVHMHCHQRGELQHLLTAIRLGKPLQQLGYALFANHERHLRTLEQLSAIYPASLLEESAHIAKLCAFNLEQLRYEYPDELVPAGQSASGWLRKQTEQGAAVRWPQGPSDKVLRQIEHELLLIQEMTYEPYFLTVHDLVCFARSQNILCQGRGSAANSVVCYCLFITEVDPARMNLLFERFISKERNEPPDIDVDFEHERREEVIQYIYQKYGRHRAALAASVVTYRMRSVVRDVGKALGLSVDQVSRLASSIDRWDGYQLSPEQLRQLGFDLGSQLVGHLVRLSNQLVGFPRHLSQHVGGFVIARDDLASLVPIENAAMENRTVIQWDKDDLETLGLMKIDVLALGMLTAIRKSLAYISDFYQTPMSVADVPPEDPAVYQMIQQADTLGVFQIESRAQMSMLPRLKPKNYYDLVVQIAIVRPGPIQGDMVHPYLARRNGEEPVVYPSEAVKEVLERTLGVPIFQEQVMRIAMVAGGFSAGEADQLRRAMAAWKRKGGLEPFQQRLYEGMRERGYSDKFAEKIFNQIKGFGDYGFPESHSASFALLAYISSWLKCYHPAAFTCALLNCQPMGFYAPAQLIKDAQRHGVDVKPVELNASEYDSILVASERAEPQIQLGFCRVKGLSRAGVDRILQARKQGVFGSIPDLYQRTMLSQSDMEALAAADVFCWVAGHRHKAFWAVSGIRPTAPLFPRHQPKEANPLLSTPTEGQAVVSDYAATGYSLRSHPLTLLRDRLERQRVCSAAELLQREHGRVVRVAGLVICRQRPATASGVTFVTLEDETGQVNVVVWPATGLAQRRVLLKARLMVVSGVVQKTDEVLHLIAGKLDDYSDWLGTLSVASREFY